MKNQPGDALSMQDLAFSLERKKGTKESKIIVPETQIIFPGKGIGGGMIDQEKEDRENYNKTINEHLPEYTSFIPMRKVVVRCYVMEDYEQGGIMIRPDYQVFPRTANGMGVMEPETSPYPYSRKAVVVAVPEGIASIKAGDIVLLNRGTVLTTKANVNTPFHLPNGFTTESWPELEPPTNMQSPHYGYLIVEPTTDIIGKIKE